MLNNFLLLKGHSTENCKKNLLAPICIKVDLPSVGSLSKCRLKLDSALGRMEVTKVPSKGFANFFLSVYSALGKS